MVSLSEPSDAGADPAGLVLVSTPIGNLADMTFRGVETLRNAQLILCEDTRTTARLLRHYNIDVPTSAVHEYNEEARIPGLLARLKEGMRMALVSDAGTPVISDPGYRLVRAAIAAGIAVSAAPGVSAAVAALTLSGLPPHPFLFFGFLPPKSGARRSLFGRLRAAEMAGLRATLIFYEAPHRLLDCLEDVDAVFGVRPAAVARELTKRFEEIQRGPALQLLTHFGAQPPRGEISLLVGPPQEEMVEDFEAMLQEALMTQSVKQAVETVSACVRAPRKAIYARALALAAERAKGE